MTATAIVTPEPPARRCIAPRRASAMRRILPQRRSPPAGQVLRVPGHGKAVRYVSGIMTRPHVHASTAASIALYLALLAFSLLEKFGQVTSDTRIAVIESPWEAIRSTFSLWNPQVSMGELQNQAYGYLF